MTTVAGATVVAGVDGSPSSRLAVEVAAAEAVARRRSLRIVHALSWPKLPVRLPPGVAEVAPQRPADLARDYLAEAATIAGKVAPDPCRDHRPGGRQGGLIFHAACPVAVVRARAGR